MIHRHAGTYGSRTPRGRYVHKKRPIHSQSLMNKNKNKTYMQLRRRFNIRPKDDDDCDKVPNYMDCRPWDKKRQDNYWTTFVTSTESSLEFNKRKREELERRINKHEGIITRREQELEEELKDLRIDIEKNKKELKELEKDDEELNEELERFKRLEEQN